MPQKRRGKTLARLERLRNYQHISSLSKLRKGKTALSSVHVFGAGLINFRCWSGIGAPVSLSRLSLSSNDAFIIIVVETLFAGVK